MMIDSPVKTPLGSLATRDVDVDAEGCCFGPPASRRAPKMGKAGERGQGSLRGKGVSPFKRERGQSVHMCKSHIRSRHRIATIA